MRYEIQAYNTATASANKIHDDTVARQLGFRGGLVPGVDVYAYLCHWPAALWGRAWLERGTLAARFEQPVYDGDAVTVEATGDDTLSLSLTLRDSAGEVCATAKATLPTTSEQQSSPPDPSQWPSDPPIAEPPPATADRLQTTPLGSIRATFHADRAVEYLDDVREQLPLFREKRFAHPGWLLRFANYVLTANVTLGPWIHVESKTQFFSAVDDGDEVETRALVAAVYERRGHHFVDLDVLQLVDERPVAHIAHTAIYQPRGVERA